MLYGIGPAQYCSIWANDTKGNGRRDSSTGKYWAVGRVGEWMSLTMYKLPNLINCSLMARSTADTHHDVVMYVHCINT